MPQSIQKMTESTPDQQDLSRDETPQPQKKPWLRMEGESLLWFNRFKLYKSLGPKRTLLAALEQERAKIRALKSTETSEKPAAPKSVSKKRGTQAKHLQEVPKPKPAQVPGSWKQASIKFHWVERARAYDEFALDYLVERHLDDILQDAAVGIERVRLLKELLHLLQLQYNTNHNTMTYEQELAFISRMQSIMKDIKDEMSAYDESITRVIVRRWANDVYTNATPEERKAGKIEVKRGQN